MPGGGKHNSVRPNSSPPPNTSFNTSFILFVYWQVAFHDMYNVFYLLIKNRIAKLKNQSSNIHVLLKKNTQQKAAAALAWIHQVLNFFKLMSSELQLTKLKCQSPNVSIDRSLWNQFNFFVLICIFVWTDWLLVRSELASGLTNDLPIGKNYLQACSMHCDHVRQGKTRQDQ